MLLWYTEHISADISVHEKIKYVSSTSSSWFLEFVSNTRAQSDNINREKHFRDVLKLKSSFFCSSTGQACDRETHNKWTSDEKMLVHIKCQYIKKVKVRWLHQSSVAV